MKPSSLLLPPALAAVLLLAACNASTTGTDVTPDADGASLSSAPVMMEETDDTVDDTVPEGYDESSEPSAALPAEDGAARIVTMNVTDWKFEPSSIVAVKGEKLVIRVTGEAGAHSFAVPELGLNVKVGPGETVDVEIPTGTAGTFSFRCAIPCGPGHKDMKGEIVIS